MNIEQKARELWQAQYDAVGYSELSPMAPRCVFGAHEQFALNAIVAALTPPEGYVLVPLEPTDDMAFPATHIEVGYPMWAGSRDTCTYAEAKAIWHAMIAARPEVL